MKTNIFLLVFSIFILLSCNEPNSPSSEFDCPLWYDPYSVGFNPPIPTHIIHDVSPDREKLAFSHGDVGSYILILHVNSGYVEKINFQDLLPNNVIPFGFGSAIWCPYDNDKLLIQLSTLTDTIGDARSWIWGRNTYILTLNNLEMKKITLKEFGPAGNTSVRTQKIIDWYRGDNSKTDLFLYVDNNHSVYIYDLKTEEKSFLYYGNLLISISTNNKYWWTRIGQSSNFINDLEFNLEKYESINDISWNCDRKLAISLMPDDKENTPIENKRFSEIWIIDVEDLMQNKPSVVPIKKINLRKNFCMYSYGIWAHYLTDTTLAVSMFAPDGDFSYLYEISTDGKLLRQLTFNP